MPGRGPGVFVVLFMMALPGGARWLFAIAARKQSPAGLITMTVVLAHPLVMLVARPVVLALKARSFASEQARVGDFSDPALRSMARATKTNDTLASFRPVANGS